MGNRRIWCGIGVMLLGVCASWPFRKHWLPPEQAADEPAATALAPLVARPAVLTRLAPPADNEPSFSSVTTGGDLQPLLSAREPLATRSLARMDDAPGVPGLAADFAGHRQPSPLDPRSAVTAAETSTGDQAGADLVPLPRRYRIGKHDTLEGIAERLLGSPQYADELLAANPGVILVPEILPVGATIVIPDVDQAAETLVRVPPPRD